MYTIKCSKCKRKLLKYRKFGAGRVLRCWHTRIERDWTVREGATVKCECGAVIGTADNLKIRMKQSAFTHTGTCE